MTAHSLVRVIPGDCIRSTHNASPRMAACRVV